MENRNINGAQINQSVTIVEKAGIDIEDCRNRLLVYDENGDVVLATDGKKPIVGVALIEAGANDISGVDIDIQIKDIGYAIASEAIEKGSEITATTNGLAKKAAAGDYVIGIALNAATAADDYIRVQVAKYQKSAAAE